MCGPSVGMTKQDVSMGPTGSYLQRALWALDGLLGPRAQAPGCPRSLSLLSKSHPSKHIPKGTPSLHQHPHLSPLQGPPPLLLPHASQPPHGGQWALKNTNLVSLSTQNKSQTHGPQTPT